MAFGDGKVGGPTAQPRFTFGVLNETVYKPMAQEGTPVGFGKTPKGHTVASYPDVASGGMRRDIFGKAGNYLGSQTRFDDGSSVFSKV